LSSTINASNTGFGGIIQQGDSSGSLQLQTAGTTAVTIDTSQNVGIGTATPGAPLSFGATINSAGTPNKIRLYESGANLYGLNISTGQLEIIAGTSGSIVNYTNGAERMRIDSSGIVTGTAGNLMLVSSTALATTSGTSKDFTSIPSWVKRITIMFNAVSLSGSAHLLIQIGTGGTPTTSGYSSTSSYALASGSASGGVSSTAGYIMYVATASYVFSGHIILTNVSGNIWVSSGLISNATTTPYTGQTAGTGTISSTLDMVRITTSNGTDTFDAGSVNILYE